MTRGPLTFWGGVLIAAIWLLTTAPVAGADGPWEMWVEASSYGPCCWAGAPEAGLISYDNQRWHQMQPWMTSIASPYHRRGLGICITVPPQPDAPPDSGLALYGAVICDRPLSEDASGDPAHSARGPLTTSDHIPTRHGGRWDLSYGFLLDWGYCGADERAWQCLKRWGVRSVKVTVFP
jgi:hypothetical protein